MVFISSCEAFVVLLFEIKIDSPVEQLTSGSFWHVRVRPYDLLILLVHFIVQEEAIHA